VAFGALAVFLVVYLISLLVRGGEPYWTWLDGWLICAAELTASSLCIARAFVPRPGRRAALVLGLSLLSWTIGDLILTTESLGGATPPTPSPADLFYLLFYPLAYVAVVLFIRDEAGRLSAPNWLDGAIAGLGAAAVCAAFAFEGILESTGGTVLATMTSLAYPIGDLLLLGLVVAGFAVLPGNRRAPWLLLASGMALNVVGDTFNLFDESIGSTRFGFIVVAVAWPIATVLMALSVWVRRHPAELLDQPRATGFQLPLLAAGSALAILFVASLHPVGRVAIGLATGTLLAVGVRLALSVREMQALSLERHRQAITDDLTGLKNRRFLFRVLDAYFAELASTGAERFLAFLFVDLDHFKEVNDTFGHPAGDELLRQLGPRFSTSLRDSDLLVRLGGDEFAVVLVDGDVDYATTVAERLTDSLHRPFTLDLVNATISASIGIAVAPTDALDGATLMRCADVAMYRAKVSGVPFAHFEHHVDDEGNQLRLAEELQEAIDHGELVLHYQPQLDLRTGEILAVEALVRWAHPRLGLLPPDRFLPVTEEAGLMGAVTRWVLGEAAGQCASWRSDGGPSIVAVNVSPDTLVEPGFVAMVRDQLDDRGLPAEALVLEITETSVISEFDRAGAVIEELRGLGLVVSIDDFGAGVTSLAYLSNLAVGELKLDRSFISGRHGTASERDLELIRSTIDLGHAMGLRIVAEGIEDADTLELLTELGCDIAQGYFISRPKPAEELAFRAGFPVRPAAVRV
jgi:diguanylate cyclase (GGDEF)-like protein